MPAMHALVHFNTLHDDGATITEETWLEQLGTPSPR